MRVPFFVLSAFALLLLVACPPTDDDDSVTDDDDSVVTDDDDAMDDDDAVDDDDSAVDDDDVADDDDSGDDDDAADDDDSGDDDDAGDDDDSAIEMFACGPELSCVLDDQYCSITYPGVPDAEIQYGCFATPAACLPVPSCTCLETELGLGLKGDCNENADGSLTVSFYMP